MAFSLQISAVLFNLIVGGSALQITQEAVLQVTADERMCGKEQTPYEAISAMYPGVCSVFCVPAGECEGQAQMGKLKYLGITGEGNCKSKGYTESASLGNLTQQTMEWLQYLRGPCKGMTLSKFKKPAVAEQKTFVEDRICGKEQKPYEAISARYPGICSVFCVPEGQCEGQVQTGKFNYLGITGSGNCKGSDYTQAAEIGNVTRGTREWLKTLQGPCKGMTLAKFQKAAVAEQKMFVEDRRICGKEQKPYQAINRMFPGVCSVFCVPEGQCEGQVQSGKMNYLGINGQGNCKAYTESTQFGNVTLQTAEWLKHLQGPCKGMTLAKFKKPDVVKQKTFKPKTVCGDDHVPYKSTDAKTSGVCSVYCVPEGICEQMVQEGQFNYLGINGGGDCQRQGYTLPASYSGVTQEQVRWLEHLVGPCRGMTITKYKKPDVKPDVIEQKALVDNRICGKGQSPYEAISHMFPGVCMVYCLPEGQCEHWAQTNKLQFLEITGEGNCKDIGFTQAAELGHVSKGTQAMLETVPGPCQGMTLAKKFMKPGIMPNNDTSPTQ